MNEIFVANDKGVKAGYYEGTNKTAANDFRANATYVRTVNNDQISHFFQAADKLPDNT